MTNQGNTATTAAWHDAVYLSSDGQIGAARSLGHPGRGSSPPLAANSSYQANATFTVPLGLSPGSYSLLVDADFDQAQSESSYSNNVRSVSTTVLPPQPDLLVAGLSLSPASGLQSGDSLTVQWNDTNKGLGAAATSFSDQVQIVNTTTGQTLATAIVAYNEATQGPLEAGSSVAEQYTFQLPNGAAGVGALSITVTNDIYNQWGSSIRTAPPRQSRYGNRYRDLGCCPPIPTSTPPAVAIDPSSVLQSGSTVTVEWNGNSGGRCPGQRQFDATR